MNSNNEEVHALADVPEPRSRRKGLATEVKPDAEVLHNTVTIPCHHIRLGDILLLEGHPCQVIRISTSAATGQHRYLGVDVFTNQLHEDSSFVSNPAPGVVVQTMLGPIFFAYYALDIVDGKLLCMTEAGDVDTNVPVLNQSGLPGRLEKAFASGRGRVIVMVVEENGRRLAVDMKVLHGSRLDDPPISHWTVSTEPRAGHVGDGLHSACRESNEPLLRSILERGKVDVNKLDKEQRTALFDAVDRRFESGVQALLETQINLEAMDKNGKTALDLALSRTDTSSQSIAFLLLQKGASPVAALGTPTPELLSASADGDVSTVNRLIVEAADVNCDDRLGYTPLHEALSFGRVEIATLLLQHGANVNAKLRFGGDTPLHMIVERGEAHRPSYKDVSERSSVPPLRSDHVTLIELLLRHGAVASIERLSDGATAQDVATHRLASGRAEAEKAILANLTSVLKSPPSVELSAPAETELEDRPIITITDEARAIYDNFFVRLQYHKTGAFLPRQSPVGSFIYSPECPDAKQCIGGLERWAKESTTDRTGSSVETATRDVWKWIHLPANHLANSRASVEGTFEVLTYLPPHQDILRALKFKANIEFSGTTRERETFMGESFYEIRGSSPDTRLRRPLFSQSFGQKSGCFSIVIPFFDAERLNEYLSRSETPNEGFRHRHELGSVCQSDHLHTPYSLDQSYYLSLADAIERDETQVVVKHIKRSQGMKDKSPSHPKLLTVNQLWLWRIDSATLITAFPDRCCKTSKPNLLSTISQSFTQRPPATMQAMLIQVLRHVVDFIDSPDNPGPDENLSDIFEQSIAYRAHGEMDCYLMFHRARRAQQTKYSTATGNTARILMEEKMRDEEQMCDIGQEIEHLREIKDIRDELKMIERVLEDQLPSLHKHVESFNRLGAIIQSIDFRLAKLHRLNKDAESLNHLLDLKQKQAGQADRRAEDSETQNQLLFVFTIVTVVFTPISFVSTFMAVPSRDFPQTEDGTDIGWTWWQVLAGTLATEIATFLVIAAFWLGAPRRANNGNGASAMDRFKKWFKSIFTRGSEWTVVEEKTPDSKRLDEEAGNEEALPGRRSVS
ncbi:hypothetical protein OQA88_7377 [Cercophora sp. LCS_1]